jgi:hypothetical protein
MKMFVVFLLLELTVLAQSGYEPQPSRRLSDADFVVFEKGAASTPMDDQKTVWLYTFVLMGTGKLQNIQVGKNCVGKHLLYPDVSSSIYLDSISMTIRGPKAGKMYTLVLDSEFCKQNHLSTKPWELGDQIHIWVQCTSLTAKGKVLYCHEPNQIVERVQ